MPTSNRTRRNFLQSVTASAACSLALSKSVAATKVSKPDKLTTLSATKLADMIRTGKVSSLDVVDAHLERIRQVNPEVNAVVEISSEARNAAKLADATPTSDIEKPLHGVPITIKDQFDVKGMITACGMKDREINRAAKDATAVRKLRRAGAIILGKTNVPPGCAHFETDNLLYGKTNNPHDSSRTPGGSSGGEAAIIASCGSPLGLGGDEGGSIRLPSHFCGIAGIRPAWGRVSLAGSYPAPLGGNAAFWTAGPMARHVEDLELVLRIIAGQDPFDPYTFPVPLQNSNEIALNKLRFATWIGKGMSDTPAPTPGTLTTLDNASKALSKQGARCEHGGPPPIVGLPDIHDVVWDPDEIVPDPNIEVPSFVLDAQSIKHFQKRKGRITKKQKEVAKSKLLPRFQSSWLTYLEDVDVILAPVNSYPAMKHHTTWDDIYAFNFTLAVSMLPKVPAGSVRCGTSNDGLPIGIQVISKPYREDIVFAVMKCLEKELGGWRL